MEEPIFRMGDIKYVKWYHKLFLWFLKPFYAKSYGHTVEYKRVFGHLYILKEEKTQ